MKLMSITEHHSEQTLRVVRVRLETDKETSIDIQMNLPLSLVEESKVGDLLIQVLGSATKVMARNIPPSPGQ